MNTRTSCLPTVVRMQIRSALVAALSFALASCGGGVSFSIGFGTGFDVDHPPVCRQQEGISASLIAGSTDFSTSEEGMRTGPGTGSVDGVGAAARFRQPGQIARDGAGNLYVADGWNFTVRKITPFGAVTTLAGKPGEFGYVDGIGTAARLGFDMGIAADAQGNVFVSHWVKSGETYAIRKITPGGTVTTIVEIPRLLNSFHVGLAMGPDGYIYAADSGASVIRRISPDGAVTLFAGAPGQPGLSDGVGAGARLDDPVALAFDRAGNLWMAGRQTVRTIARDGTVRTIAGRFQDSHAFNIDGVGTDAGFAFMSAIDVDTDGTAYVTTTNFDATVRRVTPSGVVTTLMGSAECNNGIVLGTSLPSVYAPLGLVMLGPKVMAVTTGNAIVRISVP